MNQPNSSAGFLRGSRRTIFYVVVAVIVTLIAAIIIPLWLDSRGVVNFPSFGNIRTTNAKAYWDASHINETKDISWGTIYPGSSNNVTFYLQSISNTEAAFELTSGNWTFRNSTRAIVLGPLDKTSYMDLSWNYDNSTVEPRETVRVALTLKVSGSSDFVLFLVNSDVKEFSVDIAIRVVEE